MGQETPSGFVSIPLKHPRAGKVPDHPQIDVELQRYFVTVWWGADSSVAASSAGESGNHWETWGFTSPSARQDFLDNDATGDPAYRVIRPGTPYFLHDLAGNSRGDIKPPEILVGE